MSKILLYATLLVSLVILGQSLGLSLASAAGSQDYSKLQMLNLDEMKTYVDKQLAEAQQQIDQDENTDATESLRTAMVYILSRPNGDNMVSQLLPPIRSRLKDLEAFEDTLASVADQAVFALTKGKEEPTKKATNLIVLENILSEFKPEAKTNKTIEGIFVKIRDAKIEIPKDVTSDLRMRGGYKPKSSPSQIAEKIIGKAQKD